MSGMKRFGHRSHVGGARRFLSGKKASTVQDKLAAEADAIARRVDDRQRRQVQLQWVSDADTRVRELRAAVKALDALLEKAKPELVTWHDRVREAVARIDELYPRGMMLR